MQAVIFFESLIIPRVWQPSKRVRKQTNKWIRGLHNDSEIIAHSKSGGILASRNHCITDSAGSEYVHRIYEYTMVDLIASDLRFVLAHLLSMFYLIFRLQLFMHHPRISKLAVLQRQRNFLNIRQSNYLLNSQNLNYLIQLL